MTGSAEGPSSESVRFEPDGHGGWTVMLDGQPQSHVDLADPGLITFEYVQHFALAIGACSPTAPAPLRVTHVGGAGLTLARWVQHTRPVSPQIVLEPDAALTAAVRERLPLPRGHRIRVRPLDGRTGVRGLATASADVLVLDAYAAGRVPAELAAPEFLADVARVLAPGGLLRQGSSRLWPQLRGSVGQRCWRCWRPTTSSRGAVSATSSRWHPGEPTTWPILHPLMLDPLVRTPRGSHPPTPKPIDRAPPAYRGPGMASPAWTSPRCVGPVRARRSRPAYGPGLR